MLWIPKFATPSFGWHLSQSSPNTCPGDHPTPITNSNAAIDRDIQLLRHDIRSQLKQLIAANLKLTDTEATKYTQEHNNLRAMALRDSSLYRQ